MLLVVGICIGDVFVLVANLIFETSLWYFFIQSYFVSVFIAILERGANAIQTQFKIPSSAADLLIGIILFFMLGCEFFISYRLILRGKEAKDA